MEYRDKDYLTHAGGLNQDDHNLLCGDNELLDGRNIYSEGGDILSRRGFRQLGQSFSNNIETMFPYKDSTGASYLLGVDSAGALKALLEPPNNVFTVGETGAGGNFETGKIYRFAVTFVDFAGRESPFSQITEHKATADATSLDLSSIAVGPPNVYYKKIYRTKGDGGVFYGSTATRIANSVTTYTDTRDDATLGALTSRNPETAYSNAEWNVLYDYHYQAIVLDTTNKTNFTMHIDWAIICNGKDRYKWRAPWRLGVVESGSASGNHYDIVITEATFNKSAYHVGMQAGMYDVVSITSTAGDLVLEKTASTRTVQLRWASSATADDVIVTVSRVLPFGVTAIDFSAGVPTLANSGAGLTGTFNYRMVAGNMNGSLSADSGTSDSVTITDDQVDVSAIPIDATGTDFTPAAGTVTIDPSTPGGGYCEVEVSGGTFGEVFTDGTFPELEFAGFTDAGNNGKFEVITGGVFPAPSSTKFRIYNADAVDTTGAPEAVAGLTLYKIGEVTFREIYRVESEGAPPWKFHSRLNNAIITLTLTDTTADASLGADIYTTTKPQNDYPTLHRHAVSLNNRLITADLDYSDNPLTQRNGALDIGAGNFDEVEGQYYLNFTPLGSYADSTKVIGLGIMKNDVYALTDQTPYRISNIDFIDESDPSIEQLAGGVGCIDHRSIKLITRSGGTQSIAFVGKDGPYEIFDNGQVVPMGAKANHPLRRLYKETLKSLNGKTQDNIPACVDTNESRYIFSIKKDSFTLNDIAVVFDFRDQSFWIWNGFDAADMCFWNDRIVHANLTKSYIERRDNLLTDFSDAGFATEAYAESKIYTGNATSLLKKFDDFTIYSSKQEQTQVLSIGSRAEFGSYRTNIGLGETTPPYGYTARTLDVDTVEFSVTKQTGDTWRYTRTGGGALNFVTQGVVAGDRIRFTDSSAFLDVNRGDFVVTGVAATYVEIENANGYPEALVTMSSSSEIIDYYDSDDENDGLTYLFKNITLDSTHPSFRVNMVPGTARFLRMRVESFLNNQQMSVAGWTLRGGLTPNRGNER